MTTFKESLVFVPLYLCSLIGALIINHYFPWFFHVVVVAVIGLVCIGISFWVVATEKEKKSQ